MKLFPQFEQNLSFNAICLPQLLQNFFGGGWVVVLRIGGEVLLSMDTNRLWILNITIIDSQIKRQIRLPSVINARPPRAPLNPIEPPNIEDKVPPTIKINAPRVIRIAPMM